MQENYDIEMDRIANEMACYFEEKFSLKELLIWIMDTVENLIQFEERKALQNSFFFLHMLQKEIINSIDVNGKDERTALLKDNLSHLFTMESYKEIKEMIGNIGICNIKGIQKYNIDNRTELSRRLDPIKVLLELAEMGNIYNRIYDRKREVEKEEAY